MCSSCKQEVRCKNYGAKKPDALTEFIHPFHPFSLAFTEPVKFQLMSMYLLAVWGLTGSLAAVTMDRSRLIRVWDLSPSHALADLIRKSWSLPPARLPKVPENVRDWHIITSGRLNCISEAYSLRICLSVLKVWPYLQKILTNDTARLLHLGPQPCIVHQYLCL